MAWEELPFLGAARFSEIPPKKVLCITLTEGHCGFISRDPYKRASREQLTAILPYIMEH